MTEVKDRARHNPDYTASAINLTNPAEVERALYERQTFISLLNNLQALLEHYPEWNELQKAQQRLFDHDQYIRELIDKLGSYQHIERGWYGVAQRKVSYRYIPERIRAVFPPYLAHRVIIEDVDKAMVEKLVKGGLVSQGEADNCKVITKEETAFIIKV